MKRGRPKGTGNSDKKSHGPLGDLIRRARIDQGLGLADVAKACGCSVQFISNIEHGRAPLPWDKVPSLAKALKIAVSDVQAANLAIRSDFKSFAGMQRPRGTKAAAFKNMSAIAASMSLLSSDPQFQEVLSKYREASEDARKKLTKAALELLN